MVNEELLSNYKKALKQKYNAICFDIDGTITKNNSTKIDDRIFPFFADIIKRRVPIVFITGRGETGTKRILDEIIYVLINEYKIKESELSKIYAIINDGARMFVTESDGNELLNVIKCISSEYDLNCLNVLNSKIKTLLSFSLYSKYFEISYSKDSKTDNIINIRLILLKEKEEITNELINIINSLIKDTNNSNLNLTIGKYNGNTILQIGIATKDKAIRIAERIIGIPQNSMLRIGDCGDKFGNDFSMLNCPQGFSVEKTSGELDKCFPVIENDRIITGVDGTLALLRNVKLLPTICLEHATLKDYAKDYAKVEKKMNEGKNNKIWYFNNIINQKFNVADGINSLYDSSSGSIKIPMYEWINIEDNNPLKQLWLSQNNSSLSYSMYDNENILLRGSEIYYYFLSQRAHDENTREDITTKEMINEWLSNNIRFLSKALVAINITPNINELNNTKMVLGIIDNIRNYLLILLNQLINNNEKSIMINLEKIDKNSFLHIIYDNLIHIEKLMKDISFNIEYEIDSKEIEQLIKKVILITLEFKEHLVYERHKTNYSKDFRAYREIDNFAENYITCYFTVKKDNNISNKGVCGVCYGGLELPIIIKSIEDRINDVSVLKFNKNVTGYSKKQSLELRFFDIEQNGGIELSKIDTKRDYIIFDDNLLTGKTMQLVITTFYDLKINVDKICVVRYPSVNRISQMFLPNHGAVDYRYFFNFIEGLYFPSPYSWRDPYSLNLYEDSLGIFDLNRRKILECLAKNGNYSENSEVVCVKRRVKNEN